MLHSVIAVIVRLLIKYRQFIRRKTITPSVLEGREEHFLESRGLGAQMKHVFEIPLGSGGGNNL